MNGNSLKSTEDNSLHSLEDLESLSANSTQEEVENAIRKYTGALDSLVQRIRRSESKRAPAFLNNINDMMQKAWAVPAHGHELGSVSLLLFYSLRMLKLHSLQEGKFP